jgi:hypothetical protein
MSILGKFLYYGQDAHLSHVNPGFYRNNVKLIEDDPYEINCVSCAIATDISLRGTQIIGALPCEERHMRSYKMFMGFMGENLKIFWNQKIFLERMKIEELRFLLSK